MADQHSHSSIKLGHGPAVHTVGHAVHHAAVEVSSLVLEVHGLEKIVVRIEREYVELRVLPASVIVDDEMSSLGVDSLLVRVVLLLVDLQETNLKKLTFWVKICRERFICLLLWAEIIANSRLSR